MTACLLVAYLREDCPAWTGKLPIEHSDKAIDILRLAGNPTGDGISARRSSFGVISCAERLIACLQKLTDDHQFRVQHEIDPKLTFEWCSRYRTWKSRQDDNTNTLFGLLWRAECAPDPPHSGLIAALQAAM